MSIRPYDVSEWIHLTTETIDWNRWNESDEYISVEMLIPAAINTLEIAWQEYVEDSSITWLQVRLMEDEKHNTGWTKYSIVCPLYDCKRLPRSHSGTLEFQVRGNNKTAIRLWISSPGPSGANRVPYASFDRIDWSSLLADYRSDRDDPSHLNQWDLQKIAANCTDELIAMHICMKAQVTALKSVLGSWLNKLVTNEIIELPTNTSQARDNLAWSLQRPDTDRTSEETFACLRKTLANLYPDEASTRRIAHDAGLNEIHINFTGVAINTWHFVLKESENSVKVESLFQVVLGEYGENQELVQAIEAYRSYGDNTSQSKDFMTENLKTDRDGMSKVIAGEWKESIHLEKQPPEVGDGIEGHYVREDEISSAEIDVRFLGNNRVKIEGFALHDKYNKGGPNIGELSFEAELFDEKLIFVETVRDQEYKIELTFKNSTMVAKESFVPGYFGMGVSFEGGYRKVK